MGRRCDLCNFKGRVDKEELKDTIHIQRHHTVKYENLLSKM